MLRGLDEILEAIHKGDNPQALKGLILALFDSQLKAESKKEHYARTISSGGGTTSECNCGQIFTDTHELNGHIDWQLKAGKRELLEELEKRIAEYKRHEVASEHRSAGIVQALSFTESIIKEKKNNL
jgi:hypothetical protein